MSAPTTGELLFAEYLHQHGIQADREYQWPHTVKRPDYRYVHPTAGEIVIEQKDIVMRPPERAGSYDPYAAIRSHIAAARQQFTPFEGYPCVLVLYAEHQSPHVSLSDPTAVLGAMYGDVGFRFPINADVGKLDLDGMTREFSPGRGKMLRRGPDNTLEEINTRISAVVTLHKCDVQMLRILHYARTHGHASDMWNGKVSFKQETRPGVIVWENAYAAIPLPRDIFRGELDRQWTVNESGNQERTFVGALLTELLPG